MTNGIIKWKESIRTVFTYALHKSPTALYAVRVADLSRMRLRLCQKTKSPHSIIPVGDFVSREHVFELVSANYSTKVATSRVTDLYTSSTKNICRLVFKVMFNDQCCICSFRIKAEKALFRFHDRDEQVQTFLFK